MTALPEPHLHTPRHAMPRHAASARPSLAPAPTLRHPSPTAPTASAHRRARHGRPDLTLVRDMTVQPGRTQAETYRPRHGATGTDDLSTRRPRPAPDGEHPYAAAVRLQRVRFGFGA